MLKFHYVFHLFCRGLVLLTGENPGSQNKQALQFSNMSIYRFFMQNVQTSDRPWNFPQPRLPKKLLDL